MLIPKTPIFLPNAQDGHLESLGFRFPAVLMDTRHSEWRPKVAEKLRAISDVFIIDPSTDILLFKDASEGENFKRLGYPNEVNAEKVYSDPGFRKEKIVQIAVQDQFRKQASVMIAPYFFCEDTDDLKFGVNISMLSETLRYLQETKQEIPVFAMLKLGSSILNRPTVINYIIDRYKEDFRDSLDGYIVVINDLDCESADQDSLLEFARLAFRLSEGSVVFANKIGPFGEVLCAVGASGFGSGLAAGEMFVVKNLQSTPKGWSKRIEKTYVPEIFDYLNDQDLKKIKYSCNCPACGGSYPKEVAAKKLHFLHTRLSSVQSLQNLTKEKRISVLSKRVDDAIQLTSKLRSRAIGVKTAYLPRWKAVLDLAKTWEFPGDDDELKTLLSELDS